MIRVILAVAGVTFAGCGMGAPSPDVAAYQKSVSELQAAVATHQTDAATTTAQACGTEHKRYDDAVRPGLLAMTNASGGMDSCQRAMGHSGPFNLGSMCGSMTTELDRHASTACTGDAAENRAEATRHCELMRGWLSQQRSQADSMMTMGGMMSGGRCAP